MSSFFYGEFDSGNPGSQNLIKTVDEIRKWKNWGVPRGPMWTPEGPLACVFWLVFRPDRPTRPDPTLCPPLGPIGGKIKIGGPLG